MEDPLNTPDGEYVYAAEDDALAQSVKVAIPFSDEV
jgi:hypothetical protein